MKNSAINIGNRLIDEIESMSNDLAPKIMNKDLDLIEDAMDDNDLETLRRLQTFLGYNWRPDNDYFPLVDFQRLTDELYDQGVKDVDEKIAVENLDAFWSASKTLVRFGYKKWSDAAILAMVHPEDTKLITALVIDRGVSTWSGLSKAVTAIKGIETVSAKEPA